MSDRNQATSTATPRPAGEPGRSGELESLAAGAERETIRQVLGKPKAIVGILLGIAVVGIVILLQRGPSALTLQLPEAKYELLPNQGLTAGVPIEIHLGPLTLFQISDPMAGGAGAGRARQVVESLTTAVEELRDSPGRVITIDSAPDGMPRIVQKETSDAEDAFEIITVTSDDTALMQTDDAKLLARIWAERLVDSLKVLVFAQPPEFSRDTEFGAALDTLFGTADRESGSLTSEVLAETFEQLPEAQKEALTTFPPLPETADQASGSATDTGANGS